MYSKSNATTSVAAHTLIFRHWVIKYFLSVCVLPKQVVKMAFSSRSAHLSYAGWYTVYYLHPLPGTTMTGVRDFVAGLPEPVKVSTKAKKQRRVLLGVRACTT